MYMLGGQRTVSDEVDGGDWRPSGNSTRSFHIE